MKPGQRVVVALRKMIAAGQLKPGERIAEIATAEALGVSRMPVRTALRALEHEGLVVKLGARGYTAAGVSSDDVTDAIEVRGALEGLAARRAALRGLTPAHDAALAACLEDGDALFAKARLEDGDLDRYHDLNLRFHATLVKAAGGEALAKALARNNGLPFASADALALDWSDLETEFEHLRAAHAQHHAVYAAIKAGDALAAERLMRDHAFAAIRNAKVFDGVDGAWRVTRD
jgi:GntR family transcriptional regulator of vanillate catabolism